MMSDNDGAIRSDITAAEQQNDDSGIASDLNTSIEASQSRSQEQTIISGDTLQASSPLAREILDQFSNSATDMDHDGNTEGMDDGNEEESQHEEESDPRGGAQITMSDGDGAIVRDGDITAAEEQDDVGNVASDVNNENEASNSSLEENGQGVVGEISVPFSSEQDTDDHGAASHNATEATTHGAPSDDGNLRLPASPSHLHPEILDNMSNSTIDMNNDGDMDDGNEDEQGNSRNDADNDGTDGVDGNQDESQQQVASHVSDQSITTEVSAKIMQFLTVHGKWKICGAILNKECSSGKSGGRIAILNSMKDSMPVKLHSLKKTPQHNAKVGTVVGYTPETDRFVVNVNDREFALFATNLRVVSSWNEGESKPETPPLPLSVDNLANALFRKGMLLKGNISIPGLTGERREYQLIVEETSVVDEMGQSAGILARHKAYDDEQYVYIKVEKSDSDNLSIQFADGETQCRGIWNTETQMFEGSVRQLMPTEDGGSIYFAQDKVTHTFTLSPATAMYPNGMDEHGAIATIEREQAYTTLVAEGGVSFHNIVDVKNEDETKSQKNGNTGTPNVERVEWEQDLISNATQSIANLRHETNQLGFELLDECENMCTAIDSLPKHMFSYEDLKPLTRRLVTEVQCKDLTAINSLAAERTCALLRRWASLLDKMPFESEKERLTILAQLQEKGMTRVEAHKESDTHKQRARQVVGTWDTLDFLGRLFDTNSPRNDLIRILQMCSRLDQNYKRFDEALRRAEVRLTNEDFQQWFVSNKSGDDVVCTICHVPLNDDAAEGEKVLCLPCSHRFHDECLREWLHHHLQCPVCRFELRSKCDDSDE